MENETPVTVDEPTPVAVAEPAAAPLTATEPLTGNNGFQILPHDPPGDGAPFTILPHGK